MAPLPKATCPLCRGRVAVRRGGQFREHQDHRHELYGTGRGSEVPKCPASGLTPDEVVPLAKLYIGERVAGDHLDVTVRTREAESPLEGRAHLSSPGFDCGGPPTAGSTALARSILRDYLGPDHPDVERFQQRFEAEVLAELPTAVTWRLTGEQIANWLDLAA